MMRRQLARLNAAINANGHDSRKSAESMQTLIRGWIQNHISDTDMDFARYCSQQPETLNLELPSPRELLESGFKVAHVDKVGFVHEAGEISSDELKARLKIRD